MAKVKADKEKVSKKYSSKDINTYSYPDNVRRFPAMYIGDTAAGGLFLILRELLDNVVDEFDAGRAKTCSVFADIKANRYWVHDDGKGVPQGIKKQIVLVDGKEVTSKMPTMQAVFGALHTSGKQGGDAYKTSRGVHGIGAKATNALSNSFKVWTKTDGEWYHIAFSKGRLKSKGITNDKPKNVPPELGKIKSGTLICYEPDSEIFSAKSFGLIDLHSWAEIASYLSPKFTVNVYAAGKSKKYYSERGPLDYLDAQIKALKAEPVLPKAKTFVFKNAIADVAVAFTNYDSDKATAFKGFTNGLVNSQGGTHVDSVFTGMLKALKPLAKKKQEFTAHEFRDGLVGLVNAKLSGAKFTSQAKVQLSDERLAGEFQEELQKAASKFFKENPKLAKALIERATKLRQLKTQFKASKSVLQKLNKAKRQGLPAKYAPYQPGTKAEMRELFLVEGDSAGGNLKVARQKHQAVLPLKGKISNAMKDKGGKTLESEEVINILAAIGFDPKATDPYAKLAVQGKLILLADPDPDGKHINILLLALIFKYLPRLFEMGIVYVADAPEFYAYHKKELISGDTLSEVRKKLDKLKAPNVAIQHIKGWGEVDVSEIEHFAVNAKTRRLIQIKTPSGAQAENFTRLMNEDVVFRRELIGI